MVHGLLERGVPIYQGPERAARAMAALLEYHRVRARLTSEGGSYSVAE